MSTNQIHALFIVSVLTTDTHLQRIFASMVLLQLDSFDTLVIPSSREAIQLFLTLTSPNTPPSSPGRRSQLKVKKSSTKNASATSTKSSNKVALDPSSSTTSNMKILVNTTAVVSVVKSKPTWLLMVLPQSTSIVKSKTKSISNILPNTSNSGVQSNSIQSTIMLNHTSSGSSTAKNSTQKTKESKLFLSVFLDQCVSTAQDIKTLEKSPHTIQV